MGRRVLVLNGPNLGRLGVHEPDVYGPTTYAELEALCVGGGSELSPGRRDAPDRARGGAARMAALGRW